MAATCLDRVLGASTPTGRALCGVPRFSTASSQLQLIVTAANASTPALIAGQSSLFQYPSSKQIVSASKQKRSPVLDFDEDEEEDDDDSDDEDDELMDMEEWLKNKPVGFGGAGKSYDTSLEDRLLEEIKREQLAQAAARATSKVKKPTPTIKQAKKPANDITPEGVEVFMKNLPRKKNVERDLRAALRSVTGLLHIRPLVSGNEKTREPVCKGIGFLTFATLDDAEEFVERYNGESVLFGKVEKRIVCELAKTSSPHKESSTEQPSSGPRLDVRDPLEKDRSFVTPSTSSFWVEDVTAVEIASELKKSEANPSSRGAEVIENSFHGDDSSGEDDADLFELEQQIWSQLENEEDFELDLELEAELEEDDRSEDNASSLSEDGHESTAFELEVVRPEEEHRPQVSGQGFGKSITPVESKDDDSFSKKKSPGSLDEKEKKIRELEAKLEELQSQLNKRNSMEFSAAKDAKVSVSEQEHKIEILEQRLLRRAKARKETNVSKGKPTGKTGVQKNPSSTPEKSSKDRKPKPPPRLKLGASSRLKKREREIFTEALSKYSAPSRD